MMHRVLQQILAVGLLVATAACADEDSVKKAFQTKFPKAVVDTVTLLPELGLYEIVLPRGDEPIIIYTDEKFTYMLQGSLVETKSMTDLTERKRARLTAIDFSSLPLDQAIKKVKGKGTRKVAVFSDPDCPYCKRVEHEFEKLDDVTIYIMLYPIEELHPKAPARARSIWCAPDRVKAWDDYMLRGTAPAAATCDNPVDAVVAFGKSKGITGTPTLVFEDGSRMPGALNSAQIEAQFANAAKK